MIFPQCMIPIIEAENVKELVQFYIEKLRFLPKNSDFNHEKMILQFQGISGTELIICSGTKGMRYDIVAPPLYLEDLLENGTISLNITIPFSVEHYHNDLFSAGVSSLSNVWYEKSQVDQEDACFALLDINENHLQFCSDASEEVAFCYSWGWMPKQTKNTIKKYKCS